MTTPPYLQKGDLIGITAPARKICEDEVLPTVHLLEKEGFRVLLSPHLFAADHQFAGSDAQRCADFQALINNSEVKAILCARGGYGSVRIIDRLDFTALQKNPKWICGYSDVTVFHSHIHRHLQMATLHCAMAIDLKSNISKTQSLNSILQAWRGEKMHYTTLSHPLNRMGKAKGKIIGGNLSILYSLLGSASDIETDGAILFIEDLDEYLYHIDRMMLNMKRNGKLSRLAALLVGGMTKMNDNETPYGKNAEEIIAEHCAEYNYPLIFRFPTGHIEENLALKLGCEHQLLCDENGGIIMG